MVILQILFLSLSIIFSTLTAYQWIGVAMRIRKAIKDRTKTSVDVPLRFFFLSVFCWVSWSYIN
jgi:hypothetical protein